MEMFQYSDFLFILFILQQNSTLDKMLFLLTNYCYMLHVRFYYSLSM